MALFNLGKDVVREDASRMVSDRDCNPGGAGGRRRAPGADHRPDDGDVLPGDLKGSCQRRLVNGLGHDACIQKNLDQVVFPQLLLSQAPVEHVHLCSQAVL